MDDRFRKNDCKAKCCKNLKAGILAVFFFLLLLELWFWVGFFS